MKQTGFASIDKPWLKYYDTTPENIEIPDNSIYDYLHSNNTENLDDVVLNYYHKKITYRQLFQNVEYLAGSFEKIGIKKGDIVPICALTTPEILYSFLALNKIGAISKWIDPRIGADGIIKAIEDNKSTFLIVLDVLAEKINELVNETSLQNIVCFSLGNSMPRIKQFILSKKLKNTQTIRFKGCVHNGDKLLRKNRCVKAADNICGDDPCCIVYTGGTTGKPKAVFLSNKSFVAMAVQYSKLKLDMQRGDTFLSIIPPFFPYGICVSTYVPMALGLETIIIPKFDISMFTKLMLEYRPNHTLGVPKYWEEFMKAVSAKHLDLSFIKSAGCGGDGMNAETERKINSFLENHNSSSKVLKGYGMTEVSATAASCTDNCNEIGSVGIPLICNIVSIFERGTEKELSYLDGKVGEICINSPCTMMGYQNNDMATNELIKIHGDGKRWVHTGDCGRIDADGRLYIEGRYKRIILRRGQTIYPNVIESIIMQNAYIEAAAVVAMKHPDFVNVPVACVTVKENCDCDIETVKKQLRSECCRLLPEYSVPYAFLILESFPYTGAGKIDFTALEKLVQN